MELCGPKLNLLDNFLITNSKINQNPFQDFVDDTDRQTDRHDFPTVC